MTARRQPSHERDRALRGRRHRAVAVAGAALAAAMGTLAGAAPASAGGGALVSSGSLDVTTQNVYASWAEGQERLLLDLTVAGNVPADAVARLVVATPSQPTIAAANPEVLTALQDVSAPELIEEEQWWPDLDSFSGADEADAASVSALTMVDGGQSDLGAVAGDAVIAWLQGNGVTVPDADASAIRTYAGGGWWFTVLQFTPPEGTAAGGIPPIELTFASPDLVVPMLMSATGSRELALHTTVIGSERLDRTDSMRGLAQVVFAGPVSAASSPALTDWLAPFGGSGWATTVTQTFPSPSRITQDIRFAASTYGPVTAGTEVKVVRRVIWGVPAGLVLVAGGMLLVAVIGVTISQLTQRRRG